MPKFYKNPKYKPIYKRAQIYGGAALQLSKDVRYLKTVINSEPHNHAVVGTGNIDNVGTIISLNNIVQGDTVQNRTGNGCLPRFQSVNMHINKKITAAGTVDHETIRMILFRYWGETTSAAPVVTIAEVLNAATPLSHLNPDNAGRRGDRERRIEVHKSKLFTLDSVANTSRTYKYNIQVNGPNKQVKDHIKFFSQGTNPPVSGGFYLLFISDNATGANKSAYGHDSKLTFYDN